MLHAGRHFQKRKENRRLPVKMIALCASLVLAAGGVIGGTLAWLTDQTEPVENHYSVGQVSCKVIQDESSLSNVKVKNTSDDTAYIRVRLIGYQTDAEGKIIGGIGGTGLPEGLANMEAPEGWLKIGEYYYCTSPIPAGNDTPVLIANQPLDENQTVQVLAEAIQGKPADAVEEAWTDVDVNQDGILVDATTSEGA